MKKKISTTILIAIVCFTNYAQQNSDVFYYYQGKRIVLTQITNKISVHFSHDASLEQIYEIINKDEIFLPTSLTNIENNFFRIAVLETKGSSDLQQSTIDFLKERPEVVSVAFLLQYHKTLLSLTDEFIVKLKQNTEYARLQMLAIENNCSIIKESKFVKNQYTLSASKTSYLNTIQMANFFYETGFFEISEPDFIAFNALNSDDPYFENQWGLKNVGQYGGVNDIDIKIEDAWIITQGSPDIKIAVVDVGVELNHPDLKANLLAGFDATGNNTGGGIIDATSIHGVPCAGIVAAVKDNRKGICGVAPKSKIIPICAGHWIMVKPSWLTESIDWAWQNGTDVISNSWSGPPFTPLTNAIERALQQGRVRNGDTLGCVLVFAAGNDNTSIVNYPASLSNVISVGAVSPCGERKSHFSCDGHLNWGSNFGNSLDIVAPGVFISTTDLTGNDGYNYSLNPTMDYSNRDYTEWFEGTSAAAPFVAGVAALMLAVNPNLTQLQVRDILESTAQKVRLDLYEYGITFGRQNGTWHEEVGHGLVDAYAAVLAAQCMSTLPNIQGCTISQNTTWNTPVLVVDSITITSGATLTITSDIKCQRDVSIIVKPGAKLILDGGTLTNGCFGGFWQGITVQGYPFYPGEGTVELKNGGKIENAICGITSLNGGKVKATNAHFVNNTIGVKFEPVSLVHGGNSSSFTGTNFVLDNNYLGNLSDFESHIIMHNSGNVGIDACNFFSTAPQNNYNRNNGVTAFNSSLRINALCIPPPCSTISTIFNGFNNAITVYTSGNAPSISIAYSCFTNNMVGVNLEATNYASLINNQLGAFQHNNVGACLNNTTGYVIEENEFYGSRFPQPNVITTGLAIENSGIFENAVYKNSFHDLYVGQNFICANSCEAYSPLGGLCRFPFSGVQSLCNTFSKNLHRDILVGTPLSIVTILCPPDFTGIRDRQGTLQMAAGNTFSQNITNFESQSSYNVDYYHTTNPSEIPTTSGLITKKLAQNSNGCASNFGRAVINPKDLESALAQYDEWNEQYEYWKARWYEVCGEGGRKAEEQKSKRAEEQNAECDFILDMVSYYSALKDNYFNRIIVAAMNNYELEITNYETLRFLFSYRGQYQDYLSITETYLAENNFAAASSTLSTIYEKFKLSEVQVSELTSLQIYVRWLQQLEEKGETIYKLPENEIEYLVNYVETRSGRGVVFANNILCGPYNICKDNYELRITNYENEMEENNDEVINQSSSAQSELSEFQKALANITLVPNPTTGELRITNYELRIDEVEIYDIYGKKQSISNLKSQIEINISHLPNGIYFVKIKTEAGEVMRKVVKQ